MIEIAVYQSVEEMTDVEPALPTRGVRVAYDVNRATVAQQMIELRPIGQLIDPLQVYHQQPACVIDRGVQTVEVDRLPAVIGAPAHDIALVAHHIDQFELLEERGERIKAFAHLGPRFNGDA